MRYLSFIFISVLLLFGCKETAVKKPDNLISEDKMVNILYDLSVLEGIKANNPSSITEKQIDPLYIYKKYKIDSLQFANSDRYYAADVNLYTRIYDAVSKRIAIDKKAAETAAKTEPKTPKNPEIPKDTTTLSLKKRQIMARARSKKFQQPLDKK